MGDGVIDTPMFPTPDANNRCNDMQDTVTSWTFASKGQFNLISVEMRYAELVLKSVSKAMAGRLSTDEADHALRPLTGLVGWLKMESQ